jgi:UDP-N-acetylmuramyl pentapeptide phosphotransferase/UDP-N-acetylglucosamine-1-phosphate transferase
MTLYTFFVLASFLITGFMVMYFVTPVIIQVVKLKRLFEKFSDRSSHSQHVPSFGGVTFFILLVLSLSLSEQIFITSRSIFLIPACLVIFFTGLKDDMTGISPWNKIMMQLLATTLLFVSPDFQITNLHGFLGIHEITPWLCIPLSYMVVIFYVNAYNLIDGIDGLASSLGAMFFTFFALTYYLLDDYMMTAVCLSVVGSFFAFLRYNISKDKRIFLGDTGSLFIGFLVAAIVINILSKDYQNYVHLRYISNLPLIIISALYIPVFDSIRVFIIRLQTKGNPFAPDRSHIHHVLLDYFHFSHRKTSLMIVSLNSFILLLMGLISMFCNHRIAILSLLTITLILSVVLRKLRRKIIKSFVSQ